MKQKCEKSTLVPRQRLFAEVIVRYGFERALRLAGYSEAQLWRIFNNPDFIEHVMTKIAEELSALGIDRKSLVKEYLALRDDPKATVKDKEAIMRNVIDWSAPTDERPALPVWSTVSRLKPSKEAFALRAVNSEIQDAQIIETAKQGHVDNGSESSVSDSVDQGESSGETE